MLIRQGEVRKWLNGESFICGVMSFFMVLEEYEQNVFLFHSCIVFLFVRLILSLICTKQTVIHPAFSFSALSQTPYSSSLTPKETTPINSKIRSAVVHI